MANIKSQKKRIRQDAKRNLRNKSIKTELKSSLKSLYSENGELIAENKVSVLKKLDKAFTDGIISKNYRDRNKSRISKL
ncbi:MAG: 30S ribosomal protein S20 [Candidatus Actinomarina sp.]|jgi:small subunit ribosomal protein S20|nr:30S ribosomal protein S20 [Actinomycetota bacterium]MBL6832826.1 30S ribosomal protein S20 [Candidatus Actinomarina sp.]MBL6837247.1 30S ribosomal protein S20 [Candidatus Actinomarina sp.]MDB2326781.1 30S ribosomal protein S20 [Candidatus Actinomarina sp.]MDB4823867.1 30S ribosomal protein S20 [Acidimicrobiia bacterium]